MPLTHIQSHISLTPAAPMHPIEHSRDKSGSPWDGMDHLTLHVDVAAQEPPLVAEICMGYTGSRPQNSYSIQESDLLQITLLLSRDS